ncbi:MAG: hypothetical protein ACTHJ0_09775 [Flavipsychrobacter sp.]
MNDIVQLLQQINEMNSAWLQVAVSAQSAFDTIDAAALKTQKRLKDTIAQVNDLDNSLLRISSRALNIKISSVNINENTLQTVNRRITRKLEIVRQNRQTNDFAFVENNSEGVTSNIPLKIGKSLFKGIAKTGVQSLLKRTPLKRFLSKEVLKRGIGSLLKNNLIEEGASGMSEIVGEGFTSMLGDFGFGEIAAGLGGLGVEAGMLALAPEVALAIGGIYLLKKLTSGNSKTYPLPPMPYYDNSMLPITKNNFEVISIDPRTGKELKGKAARESKYASIRFKTEQAPAFVPNYNSIPKLQNAVDNTLNYAEIQTKGNILAAQKKAAQIQSQPKFVPNYKLIGGQTINAVDHTANFAETQIKGFEHFAKERAQKKQATQSKSSLRDKQVAYEPQYATSTMSQAEGRVINININRAFIENFSIHAQNIQQGYDNLKQKVEEIFLEILNSANAIHD